MDNSNLEIQVNNVCSDLEDFQESYDIEDIQEVEDLQEYVSHLGELKRSFRRVHMQLKRDDRDDFATKYPNYDRDLNGLNEDFKLARQKLSAKRLSVKQDHDRKFESEALQLDRDEKGKIANLLVCAEALEYEITVRCETLSEKCSVNFSILNDYEILDLKKREESLQSELRDMFGKVSSLEQFLMPCGNQADEKRHRVTELRGNCASALKDHLKALKSVVNERDISEEKLRNSAALDIKLSKFKGYDSDMDIFTFRSEFSKLVEPVVVKRLWPDYLKNNYLEGPAHDLVKKIESIDEIWEKLCKVYGNTHLMLQNRLGSLGEFSTLEKLRDDEKISLAITKLLNLMNDLRKLAEQYGLETELYFGGGTSKVLNLLGKDRLRKFLKSNLGTTMNDKLKWSKLIEFLTKERDERESYVLHEKVQKSMTLEKGATKDLGRNKDEKSEKKGSYVGQAEHDGTPVGNCVCHICGSDKDHVLSLDSDNKPYVEYVSCKSFVDKTPKERNKVIFKKRLCCKCLKPGVKWNAKHDCQRKFQCKQPYTKDGKELKCGNHVLVCGYHCDEQKNKELLELYKREVINSHGNYFDFTKNVSISNFSETYSHRREFSDIRDSSIFAFQTIEVAGLKLNVFYDNGCGDIVVSKETVDKLFLIGRAEHVYKKPITLYGVGGLETTMEHGAYGISLPLKNGVDAKLSGVCAEQVTIPFPTYPLEKVEKDIVGEVKKRDHALLKKLPKLPKSVGGKVDVIIGKHYLKYFPVEIFRCDSGLTLYDSHFKNVDGSTGIVSGPHPEFTKIERSSHFVKDCGFYSEAVQAYRNHVSIQEQVPLLGFGSKEGLLEDFKTLGEPTGNQESTDPKLRSMFLGNQDNDLGYVDLVAVGSGEELQLSAVFVAKSAPKCLKSFEECEKSGTNISFRCMDCRNCKECLKGGLIEEISIQEEQEQDLINKSVTVDIETGESSAYLPFTSDPDKKLPNNRTAALKVYEGQIKKLAKSFKDKADVIKAEKKLQDLGFVDFLDNLSEEEIKLILDAPVQYFIPWRIVWSDSLSTPVRPVFDARMRMAGGASLNEILPKGANNMNSLIQILIRWSIKNFAFHSDVSKMYNRVNMEKCHWRYQLYLWDENLEVGKEPRTKVIKTCIYGVKPSGNQAERALRLTAEMCKDEYPMAYETVNRDIYVDDVITGEDTIEEREKSTEQLIHCLKKGGFTLKGLTFSGQAPDDNLSSDKESISVGGLKWYPEKDTLMLKVGTINFARKIRGRKIKRLSEVPDELTLRDCVRIVAEIFDPLGKITPILAGFKLDISHLHRYGLNWDSKIPDNVRNVWLSNFETIEELGKIEYKRAIVPPDAKSLDIFTLETGDASLDLICAATYARFQKKNGEFSCQLVFARSKVVPEGTSIPRAELMAAALNAATGYTVRKSFGKYHKGYMKLSDSMVALHWIASRYNALKTWVRTRVVEINRLSEVSSWRYVDSANMIADLGTRKGARVCNVIQESEWINGLPWMSSPESDFPVQTLAEINLSQQDTVELEKESIVSKTFHSRQSVGFSGGAEEHIKNRYIFSNYIIDPNRFRFRKVVRVLAIVLKFIKRISKNIQKIQESKIFQHHVPGDVPDILKFNSDKFIVTTGSVGKCIGGKVVELSEDLLQSAMYYFSLKASREVREYLEPFKYDKISKEIDGVLYYSGRILDDFQYDGYPDLCSAALDLFKTTFCVPVMDQYSPVAISIALETHWHHPDVRHKGVDAIWRQMERVCYIIGGQQLAVLVKKGCKKCRIINKNSIEVAMGPIQAVNLCIAPPFYACQLDIMGPLDAFSVANKRATIKVWFLIFCCCTTGATDIRVIEDYSTDQVVMGFVRFSCRFGFPKYAMPDAGGQLVKACSDVEYSFTDTKSRLFTEYGINYEVCPVGSHYQHGKVERKIREVRKSLKILPKYKLSLLGWETQMQQIANSINNLPIGLKQKTQCLENLDLITPNRLLLGRNNERCPNAPLAICSDYKRLIQQNADIFRAWFKAWMINYVPLLIERPKWHRTDDEINIGDIILFLKSDSKLKDQYQYGIVSRVYRSKDNCIRRVDISYRNANEKCNRITQRGVRELVIVYPVDELDVYEQISEFAI